MAKLIIGDNATGKVVNIVAPAPPPKDWTEWTVPDNFPVAVGDAFDFRDPMVDSADLTQFKSLQRHENLIRQLIRALRRLPSGGNAADAEGLPASASVPDVTQTETRAFFKSQIT